MTNQKDDAELVTPPPVNHTPSSSPASSLPTASAAALDGKSFDSVVQSFSLFTECRHRRLNRWRHNCSLCTARRMKSSSTTHGPLASLIKWANHPSRLNGNKSLDSMATQLLQARQRMPKGDAPTLGAMAASWGLEPGYLTKLTEKALSHLIVTARLLCG